MAGLDRFRVVVVTGRGSETGVVVRLPGVLVVVCTDHPETIETTKRLLAQCAEVAGDGMSARGRDRRPLLRIARLLTETDPEEIPDFCVLATIGERVAALVHGAMDLAADGPMSLALSGAESATWVDRLLPAEITRIDLGPAGSLGPGGAVGSSPGVEASFPLDLRVGAVPGIGATILIGDVAPMPTPKGAADGLLAGLSGVQDPATGAEAIPSAGARPAHASSPGVRAPDPMSTAPPVLTPLLSQEEAARRHRAGAEPTQAADFDELDDEDPPTELAGRDAPPAGHGGAFRGGQRGPGPSLGDAVGAHAGAHASDPDPSADMSVDDHDAVTQLPGRGLDVEDLLDDEAPTMLPGRVEQVEGVMCANGHFNHPEAPYCSECGLSLTQQTNRTVLGPRPTIGVLVFDDGQTINLDLDLVIGRQPDRDEAVRAGRAHPLAVEDGESAVSRVHAVINLRGWDATITDRGSANGTYIAPPDATVWTPLSPHQPAALIPGTRVQVGKRTFVFNSHIRV